MVETCSKTCCGVLQRRRTTVLNSSVIPAKAGIQFQLAIAILLLLFPLLSHAAITLTGADGQALTLNAPAKRIVSLAPDLTELTYDVGAGSALVGTSQYSDHPAAAKRLPRIGDAFRFDIERIVALKPELILAWQSGTPESAIERLRELRLPVLVIGTHQLGDIATNLELIGKATGHETEAHAAAQAFLTSLGKLRSEYAKHKPVRVFYEISATPLFTVGGAQFISRIIQLCGGRNIFADLTAPAAAVNLESVLARDPQAIVTGDDPGSVARLIAWHRWPQISAVRHGNLFVVGDALVSATPRLLEGGKQLCEDLEEVREHYKKTYGGISTR